MTLFKTILLALLICACTPQYVLKNTQAVVESSHLVNYHKVNRVSQWALNNNTKIYVAAAKSQFAGDLDLRTSQQLRAVTPEYFPFMYSGRERQNLPDAVAIARKSGCDYLFYPRLEYWLEKAGSVVEIAEDIAEPDDFGRDRVRVRLIIVDVKDGKVIENFTIASASAVTAIFRSGAEDLLGGGFGKALASLSAQGN